MPPQSRIVAVYRYPATGLVAWAMPVLFVPAHTRMAWTRHTGGATIEHN
jgi:hypothetical protein